MAIGMTGNVGSSPRRRRVGGVRREAIASGFRAHGRVRLAGERRRTSAKRPRVIRVPVPIDVATITATECGAFACATPLRVEHLLVLAIGEALGSRAPQDKRERVVRSTLAGFTAGDFSVDVDGRRFERLSDVVVCEGTVTLRFFSRRQRRERGAAR
jgi:hypothetical protein